MSRPRVAPSSPSKSVSTSETAHITSPPADNGRRWRVRAGAVSLIAIAIAIPVAAGAVGQTPEKHADAAAPARKVSVNQVASKRRFRKPEAELHAQAKPAVPVTTAAPKPAPTAPPTTRSTPPTTRYVPKVRYVAPKPRYVPTTRYVAPPRRYVAPAAIPTQGSGRCGGNLPPCYVMMRESKGSLTARNPSSTAAGKWQFLASTWNGYGGYASAAQAPESVQDARAAQVWAGGAGCSNWSAC